MVFALRSAAMFILASTTRAWRARFFPAWFAAVSYLIVVVLLFVVTYERTLVLLFPLWVAATSVIILFRPAAGGRGVA